MRKNEYCEYYGQINIFLRFTSVPKFCGRFVYSCSSPRRNGLFVIAQSGLRLRRLRLPFMRRNIFLFLLLSRLQTPGAK